ncbi:N/A [soil metagenome]
MNLPKLGNLVPYLFYSDIEAMIDWYSRVFGFTEKGRWRQPDGSVQNAEMRVGDTELWMDGDPSPGLHNLTDPHGNSMPLWIGVWLENPAAVDAMYDHILGHGVEPADQPHDRSFGIRTFSVKDPEGYTWGFMCPIPPTD